MTVYVRADTASVSVSPESGGCGRSHSRPVSGGVAVHRTTEGKNAAWPLTCPQCEPFLRQDIVRSAGRKVRTVNNDHGMNLAERYLGLFGASEDTIPESPDEEKHRESLERKTATDQAAKTVNLAEQSAASLNSIAEAIAGNSALMAQLVKMGLMGSQQTGPVLPADEPLPEPRRWEYPVGAGLTAVCRDCGTEFARTSNKGPAPKRCPDCKAKAAA